MYSNYRVIQIKDDNKVKGYEIISVYYDDKHRIVSWSKTGISLFGETLLDLQKDFEQAIDSLNYPILKVVKDKNGKDRLMNIHRTSDVLEIIDPHNKMGIMETNEQKKEDKMKKTVKKVATPTVKKVVKKTKVEVKKVLLKRDANGRFVSKKK